VRLCEILVIERRFCSVASILETRVWAGQNLTEREGNLVAQIASFDSLHGLEVLFKAIL